MCLSPAPTPLFLLFRRGTLKDDTVRARFGFLFRGYQEKYFFWEFVVLVRKLLVLMVLVYLEVLMCVCLFIHVRVSVVHPNSSRHHLFSSLRVSDLCFADGVPQD